MKKEQKGRLEKRENKGGRMKRADGGSRSTEGGRLRMEYTLSRSGQDKRGKK